jgi:hypothetical protein
MGEWHGLSWELAAGGDNACVGFARKTLPPSPVFFFGWLAYPLTLNTHSYSFILSSIWHLRLKPSRRFNNQADKKSVVDCCCETALWWI